jgi:hypothetical protein
MLSSSLKGLSSAAQEQSIAPPGELKTCLLLQALTTWEHMVGVRRQRCSGTPLW